MSYITEKKRKPSNVNGNRHDTRDPGIDHKKIGPALGEIRKPKLDPTRVEQLLEETKAKLIKEKEQLQEQKEASKKKGFR